MAVEGGDLLAFGVFPNPDMIDTETMGAYKLIHILTELKSANLTPRVNRLLQLEWTDVPKLDSLVGGPTTCGKNIFLMR